MRNRGTHISARAASFQTKEENKTASNARLKRNACIANQLETSIPERMSEEVHRDRHQNGAIH